MDQGSMIHVLDLLLLEDMPSLLQAVDVASQLLVAWQLPSLCSPFSFMILYSFFWPGLAN
jgi:hypothetical protein